MNEPPGIVLVFIMKLNVDRSNNIIVFFGVLTLDSFKPPRFSPSLSSIS